MNNSNEKSAHARGIMEMAGGVSHSLNQPLTSLFGALDIINIRLKEMDIDDDRINKMNALIEQQRKVIEKISERIQYLGQEEGANKAPLKRYINTTIVDINTFENQ
jgi:signal transduction histidine kinase